MSLSERQAYHSRYLGDLLVWAWSAGFRISLGDAWRSTDSLDCPKCGLPHTYQELLVWNKRSKTLDSAHADRLATDLIVRVKEGDGWRLATAEEHRPLGERWERIGGGIWGGRFGVAKEAYQTTVGWDPGHFETRRSEG